MESTLPFGLDQWLKLQQEYWQALGQGIDTLPQNPWQGLFSNWQKFASQHLDPQSQNLFQQSSLQADWFTQLGETLLKNWSNFQGTEGQTQLFNFFINEAQKQAINFALKEFSLPEQFSALFKTHSFQDDLLFDNAFINAIKNHLDIPTLGSNRELQERLQEGGKLWLEYQEALSRYLELYSSIQLDTSKLMLERLRDGSSQINTLGELHDLWVDAYESCYQKLVFTLEYRQAHGRISNAFMALRKYALDMRDLQAKQLGMPTRVEMNTALKRQHEARKQLKRMEKDMQALKQQMASLQQQLSEQSQAPNQAQPEAVSAKPTSSNSTASKRPTRRQNSNTRSSTAKAPSRSRKTTSDKA